MYGLNGQEVLIPFIYKSTDNMMIQMTPAAGQPGTPPPPGRCSCSTTPPKGCCRTSPGTRRSGAFSTFKISGYPANFLNAGQCVFAIDSTAGATWMGTDAPLVDIAEEDRSWSLTTAVRMVPQFDPEHPQMISQGPSVCVFNKEDPQEVLASWLFTQYLLTNEVQMAYSQTEGYVPVTTRAQQDPAYQDYLSRAGEDDDTYYRVKIEAAQLLLDNLGNTFTTPVFNGSTSLRDAAGQLIEDVTKSVRRDQVVDQPIHPGAVRRHPGPVPSGRLLPHRGQGGAGAPARHGHRPAGGAGRRLGADFGVRAAAVGQGPADTGKIA